MGKISVEEIFVYMIHCLEDLIDDNRKMSGRKTSRPIVFRDFILYRQRIELLELYEKTIGFDPAVYNCKWPFLFFYTGLCARNPIRFQFICEKILGSDMSRAGFVNDEAIDSFVETIVELHQLEIPAEMAVMIDVLKKKNKDDI